MENTLFPIFLKTEQPQFLIIGGGNVGLEKTRTLLNQNPNIHLKIISLTFLPELLNLIVEHPQVDWEERKYEAKDLIDVDFLILATDDTEFNYKTKLEANEFGILVNAADQPELCDFYLGSIVKKGNLKIAISTNGKSPVLARRLREHLEEAIPEDINESIENLNLFRNRHKGDLQTKLSDLNAATQALVEDKKNANSAKKYKNLVFQIASIFLAVFVGYGLSTVISYEDLNGYAHQIPNEFYYMLAIGFFAQIVDGAVGLGYGVTCSTSMMLFGVNLASISGSIHTAEMFSSAVSGFSHYKFGNVNKKLFKWIVIPGVIGAVAGASLLIYLGDEFESYAYPIVATYTMFIGIRLIIIATRKKIKKKPLKQTGLLGFAGGFFDAFGGGGWGPIVTSTLLAKGRKSKYVVGTVSLAEFFVTFAAAVTFFSSLGVSHWFIVVGLIIGGMIAAPLAAKLAGKLPQKTAVLLVAALVIISSLRIIYKII